MTPEDRSMLQVVGTSLWKNLQEYIPIFLLYGLFAPLTIITIHNLVMHRGLSSTSTKATVGVIVFSFLAATGQMIATIATVLGPLVVFKREIIGTPLEEVLNDMNNFLTPWTSGSFWLSGLPLAVNDALIIWRSWVIFSGRRWAKCILAATWMMTADTLSSDVIIPPSGILPSLLIISSDFALASIGLSFATNFLATAFIAYILRINSSLQLRLAIFDDVYFMISGFYPTLVTYLVHELSPTVEIHEAATAVYESQQREAEIRV
ncbi:hypothetical protein H0H92_005853 [Tricholoma furcatifolium]|nr:hypothetical protein H0H92_005853 [Tricholoma furcatifolium]